jgi:hypothetical protein
MIIVNKPNNYVVAMVFINSIKHFSRSWQRAVEILPARLHAGSISNPYLSDLINLIERWWKVKQSNAAATKAV